MIFGRCLPATSLEYNTSQLVGAVGSVVDTSFRFHVSISTLAAQSNAQALLNCI